MVVIGGGMAGLTAALFLRREGSGCTLIDRSAAGGQLSMIAEINDLPGCPPGTSGADLAGQLTEQVVAAGCEIRYEEATEITHADGRWEVMTSAGSVTSDAVIVSTGSALATLDVPGEARLRGRGVISCAACDGWAFKGRRICVVGGGDSALDETLHLSEVADHITLVYRGSDLTGSPAVAGRVKALPRVRRVPNATVTEITGTSSVEAVRIRHLSDRPDEILAVDGVAIYVGLRPNSSLLAGLLTLTTSGHVPSSTRMSTDLPGLFVAGDLRADSPARLLTCAADGGVAALSAARYLRSI